MRKPACVLGLSDWQYGLMTTILSLVSYLFYRLVNFFYFDIPHGSDEVRMGNLGIGLG